MHGMLKGQFFISGAIVICVLLFLGLPMMTVSGTTNTRDLATLSDNLGQEIPRAANLAITEGNPEGLGAFMDFLRNRTADRYLDVDIFWVITVPDQDDPGDLEVYSGNWMSDYDTAVVTAGSGSLVFELNDQETGSDSLSGVPAEFEMEIQFGRRIWSETVTRDKANVYAFVRMERNGNVIINEITG